MLFALFFFLFTSICSYAKVELGVDVFFTSKASLALEGKRVGLITNHTGVNKDLIPTFDLFLQNSCGGKLVAVFAPEHGFFGHILSEEKVKNETFQGVPIHSLYGNTRRPTKEMLRGIDILIYDIQDLGVRSYTYASTLFYVMEEAAKEKIPLIVLDRPNPLGGMIVDGSKLEEEFRSFIGYVDVPYCHGMTIGELALYFNSEYKIHCPLQVVSMKGWKRGMVFADTHLPWVPTSPYIPESTTPLFYATTGLIGQLSLVSIGIGYSLPFKVLGAPWIRAEELAQKLNEQNFGGVHFIPFRFTPQFGLYKKELCQGVLIVIQNPKNYFPVKTQHGILGILKSLYPKIVQSKISSLSSQKKEIFCKAEGTSLIFSLLSQEKYPAWKMMRHQNQGREEFLEKRKKYLLYN